jgi:hypothetical protein
MDKRKKGHKNKSLSIPKGSRKLHISNEIWHWKSTATSVVITAPNGDKHYQNCWTVMGWSHYDWERGTYKRYSHATPGKVKKYIEENILTSIL